MEQGAFAVVMNARSGWGRGNSTDGPSQRFARQFWDAALNEDMLEMGRANQDSKEDNLWDINGACIRWCYYGLNLFGDPQQQFRFEQACEWLTTEPEEGTIGPGDSNEISVTFDAIELAPGLYEAEIIILSSDPCSPTTIPVTMTVSPDDLQVAPAEGFESSGTEGGPFEPECVVYTLTNINGTESVNWTTLNTENWLQITPSEGLLGPGEVIDVSVCISANADLLDPNLYTDVLTFQNTDSNSIKPRPVTLTVKPPDCFTESFDDSGSDLGGLMVTFTPDGSIAYYEACRERVDEFPTDPCGGTYVGLWDDDFAEVFIGGQNPNKKISFYGTQYNRFYIGSNGYITFEQGDTEFNPSLENHFNMPRISGLFTDLNPPDDHCISYKKLGDRVVVTFQDVPLFGDKTAKNSFQIEMFFVDGTICITWLEMAETACVAGLSRGRGLPPVFFEESDLSSYPPCWPCGDFNRNYSVDFADFAVLAMHWLDADCNIPYWCGRSDLDFSGTVEMADVDIFTDNWLTVEDWWLQPVSHWKFDEGAGDIAYDSAGDNHGSLVGDTAWVTGKVGSHALDFDGDGDYVEVPEDSSFNLASNVTYSFWVKANLDWDNLSSDFAFIDKGNQESNTRNYGPLVKVDCDDTDRIQVVTLVGGTSYYAESSKDDWNADQWYHIAFVKSDTDLVFYIDGQPDNVIDFPYVFNTDGTQHLVIGRRVTGTSISRYFNGSIDDVRIYDRTLSSEEIRQLYQGGLSNKAFDPNPADMAVDVDPNTVLSWSPGKDAASHDVYFGTDYNDVNNATPDSNEFMGNQTAVIYDPNGLEYASTYYWRIDEVNGPSVWKGNVWNFTTWVEFDPNLNLISYWKFDEGAGDIAYDSAGDNHGTIYGATWITGQVDSALDFDGVDDYVDCGVSSSFKILGNLSSSGWIKRESYNYTLLGIEGGPGDTEEDNAVFFLSIKDSGRLKYTYEYNSGQNEDHNFNIVPNNTWTHVAVVRDSFTKTVKAYFNGVDTGTFHYDNQPTNPRSELNLTIGSRSTGITNFNGSIDDVRIYDRALSAEEIWQLYQGGN